MTRRVFAAASRAFHRATQLGLATIFGPSENPFPWMSETMALKKDRAPEVKLRPVISAMERRVPGRGRRARLRAGHRAGQGCA